MGTDPPSADPRCRAACLTAAGIGGVAVVRVVGHEAVSLLGPCLAPPTDTRPLEIDQLSLRRFVDDGEVIDDVLVTLGRDRAGREVIDLCPHGGRRIVERMLMKLRQVGAAIVPAETLLLEDDGLRPMDRLLAPALLRAQTNAVAAWLAEFPIRFERKLEELKEACRGGGAGVLEDLVQSWLAEAESTRLLIEGVRVVLVGPPNAGKSTLANTLAGRDQVIVSELPGTTRDWVELPAAADGVPLTVVDTAGIHEATDPLELEAIRRGDRASRTADVIVHVHDGSRPPPATSPEVSPPAAGWLVRDLHLLNKSDLPRHPAWEDAAADFCQRLTPISAVVDAEAHPVRRLILERTGLSGWRGLCGLPAAGMKEHLRRVLSERERGPEAALRALDQMAAAADTGFPEARERGDII